MSRPSKATALPPDVRALVESHCSRFREAWRQGKRPALRPFLDGVEEPARGVVLRELLRLEIAFRERAGETPRAEDYQQELPGDTKRIAAVFAEQETTGSIKDITTGGVQGEGDAAPPPAEAPADHDKPDISSSSPYPDAHTEPEHRAMPDAADLPGGRVVPLDAFVRYLTACGLMEAEELDAFLAGLPAGDRPQDGKQLAKLLYRHQRLTKFQVQAVYQGKTRGLVVGNYMVLDHLGKGGMGSVYKAEHRRMKRVVALKMLPGEACKSPQAVARFQREVEAAARLSHPNIVNAFDADEARGVHFLVMEYVDGEDLSALVKRHGALPIRTAVDYILQAARGLEYAHGHGVIHRDIKPANLIRSQEGVVKILDMGLARLDDAVGRLDGDQALTHSGQVMGTLDYLPPEQALDTRMADGRSDIYSLGCTLYYLLTGQRPYGGDTLAKKLLAHRNDPIPTISAVRPAVPAVVDSAFAAMVAKEPADRPQTMSEVIAMLENCLLDAPAESDAPGTAAPTHRSSQEADGVSPDDMQLDRTAPISRRLLVTRSQPFATRLRRRKGGLPWPAWVGWRHPRVMAVAGAVFAGILLLAVAVGMLRSDKGTLVVEVDERGATVEVLNEEGTIIVRGVTDTDALKFSIDPGKHRIRVEKEGFEFFSQDFSIARRGREVLRARLEPVGEAEQTQVDDAHILPLDGEWVLVEGWIGGGNKMTGPRWANCRVIFKGTQYWKSHGDMAIEGTIEVDTTEFPMQLDWTPLKGGTAKYRGKTTPGIFEISSDGTMLRICAGESEGKRPTEFDRRQPSWTVQVYMRKVQ